MEKWQTRWWIIVNDKIYFAVWYVFLFIAFHQWEPTVFLVRFACGKYQSWFSFFFSKSWIFLAKCWICEQRFVFTEHFLWKETFLVAFNYYFDFRSFKSFQFLITRGEKMNLLKTSTTKKKTFVYTSNFTFQTGSSVPSTTGVFDLWNLLFSDPKKETLQKIFPEILSSLALYTEILPKQKRRISQTFHLKTQFLWLRPLTQKGKSGWFNSLTYPFELQTFH